MDYKRILVALEEPPFSDEVFGRAAAIAQNSGASLLIVHALTTTIDSLEPNPSAYSESIQEFAERFQESRRLVELKLEEYGKSAIDRGIPTEWACEADKPEKVILGRAKSWDADLIVMGRRGLRGLKEVLLGSVSNYVIYHASCSVLIVQQRD